MSKSRIVKTVKGNVTTYTQYGGEVPAFIKKMVADKEAIEDHFQNGTPLPDHIKFADLIPVDKLKNDSQPDTATDANRNARLRH